MATALGISMHAPLPAALKPLKVLFLSRGESSVRTDVKGLRALGTAQFIHLADTNSAITHLLAEKERLAAMERLSGKRSLSNPVDLVVCDEHLGEGPVTGFLRELARHPAICSQPLLVLASTAATARTLEKLGLYVLQRPYSGADLEKMAQKAMSPLRRALQSAVLEKGLGTQKATVKPEQARTGDEKMPVTTAGWLSRGMAQLKEGQLAEAERSFTEVLERQHDNLEAALGMVRARRTQGDERGVERYLLKAAAALKRSGDAVRCATVLEKLPERMRENPYVHEALALMDEEKFRPAAQTFLEAAAEAPGTPLHRVISRACLMTASPDECLSKLCNAYDEMGNNVTAASLRRRLLSYDPDYKSGGYSWLDGFPVLKEAVSVMRYTTWVWRRV